MKNAILLIFSIILRPFVILCGYMINSNSFPKPLSREDEEKYLKLYSEGNEDARNILIERNLRLVAHIVKKYSNTGKETEDLISIGTIGLIKAISTYNPAKGTRLATYAARCIENAILFFVTHIPPFTFLLKKIVTICSFYKNMNFFPLYNNTLNNISN